MTDAPLFSIITITKDNPTGLQKTQASINAQSFRDFEWIVVNGGSPLSGIPANLLIEEPDSGIYDAMNKGLEASKGDYVVFLNAGDKLSDPDILSMVKRAIEHDQPDILYGDALEENLIYKKARHHSKIDHGMMTHHQSIYYRRGTIGETRYNLSYKIAADYSFTRDILKKSKIVHYCPAALCIFEAGGISQTNQSLGRQEEFSIRRQDGAPLISNIIVRSRQSLASFVKDRAPKLYQSLRRA